MIALRSRAFEWPLTPRRKAAILLASGLAGSFLALEAMRIAAAAVLADTGRPDLLEAALLLDPSNAAIDHSLGMLRYYSVSLGGARSGLDLLRRATELAPEEALYWLDLAAACESSGDAVCADRSVARALDLSGMTPRVNWAAANYYLRSGDIRRAVMLLQRLLELDASYAEPVFQACLRVFGSSQPIEETVLAHNSNPEVQLAFVNFLTARGDGDSAYAAWRRFVSSNGLRAAANSPDRDSNLVASYLDHLIQSDREDEAVAVWSDLERMKFFRESGGAWTSNPSDTRGNLVFNGGFETRPMNLGFDWRFQALPFVSTEISNGGAHTGRGCLRLEFTAPINQNLEPVYEIVPVRPDQEWVLSAYVRGESITSDSGPRLRLADPFCTNCAGVATEGTLAGTSWHEVRAVLRTGPGTHFLKISVWRPRSRSYPADITGRFWVDDVSLVVASNDELARGGSPDSRSPTRVALP